MHQSHIFMHLILHPYDLTIVLAFHLVILVVKLTSRHSYNTQAKQTILMDKLEHNQSAVQEELTQVRA